LSLTCLVASVIYYGSLCFWDTAQCDFMYVAPSIVALAVLHRGGRRRELVAGLLFGGAILVKPLAGAFGIVALAMCVARARAEDASPRAVAFAAARLAAGTFALPIATILYFAAHGALGDFAFWVLKVNAYYASHESSLRGVADFFVHFRYVLLTFEPWSLVLIVFMLARRITQSSDARSRRQWRMWLALFFAGLVGIAAQMKFFRYHFTAILPSLFAAASLAIGALEARIGPRVVPAVIGGAALLFACAEPAATDDCWWRAQAAALRYLRHDISREEFERTFAVPSLGFDYADVAAVGRWLRDHSEPGDDVVVRGFEPVVYVVAHRRYSGRFFWSNFITDRQRSMKHEAWLAEETAHFERARPRYAVAIWAEGEIDGANWFEARGYVEVARIGGYRIMERR
jgi:hypothetical protein